MKNLAPIATLGQYQDRKAAPIRHVIAITLTVIVGAELGVAVRGESRVKDETTTSAVKIEPTPSYKPMVVRTGPMTESGRPETRIDLVAVGPVFRPRFNTLPAPR